MNTLEALFSRRSVRSFKHDPVSDEDLHDILRAGMQAPSARNEQPWHFIVITDPEILQAIPKFHPYSKMLLDAPLAILVCSDKKLLKSSASWVQDCSAATQNMLLAIHAKGLGGVWLGVYPNPDRVGGMRDLFSLPEEITPVSLVAVGHPEEIPQPVDRFNQSRVHVNRW